MDSPPEYNPAARLAKSNRDLKYACTQCGREVGRDNLRVKKVVFRGMGVNGNVDKSRVTDWLCIIPNGNEPACIEKDPAWQQVALAGAPGLADTKLANATPAS